MPDVLVASANVELEQAANLTSPARCHVLQEAFDGC